jgi:hypothetical protein
MTLDKFHPMGHCHEINLSVQKTAYIVIPHLLVSEFDARAIKGGSVIQLFHKVGLLTPFIDRLEFPLGNQCLSGC